MKPKLGHKFYHFFYVLLFAGLGYFSYVLLINYLDQTDQLLGNAKSIWLFVAVVFVFNILGFSVVAVNNRINRQSPYLFRDGKKMIRHYLVVAILLLSLNYFLFVTVKLLLGIDAPFAMRFSGVRTLFMVWLIELFIVGLALVNNSYRYILELYKQTDELKESSTKAQYIALQSQLNPHFLFNSLNALISEIEYNPKNAVEFTRNLSDVYRYILQCQEQTLTTVSSELEFLNAYVFLHRVRLGDCISIENCLDVALLDKKLPPLTLQLLAENVIKHNSISVNKPMTIRLSYDRVGDMLEVSNDIRPKQGVVKLGKGLQNLSQRYRIIGNKEIIIENNNSIFKVKIPLFDE